MVNKNSSQAQKIAVIGGGIIGLCIAPVSYTHLTLPTTR